MRKRILFTFLAVIVFQGCFVLVLIILIPDKIIAPWPSLSPDFEIKQLNASCLVFSPKGKHIAIAHMDGWHLVDYQTREIVFKHKWKKKIYIYQICFSPDGKQIAIGHSDGWDVVDCQTREIVVKYRGKEDYISQMCFSPDGKKLLTTNKYNNIIVWDIESKQELFRMDDIEFCCSSGFSSDGTKIIAAVGGYFSKTGYGGIWDIETGEPERIFDTRCTQVDYAPDEKTVILANYKQIERWDVEMGKKINNIAELRGALHDINFTIDGKQMMVGFSQLGNAILIDIESGRILKEFEIPRGDIVFLGLLENGAFALIGNTGVSPKKDSVKNLLDKLPFSDVFTPAFDKGGLSVYSTSTGEIVVRMGGYNHWRSFALSPDRSIAAGIAKDSVCFWDISNISGDEVFDLDYIYVACYNFLNGCLH